MVNEQNMRLWIEALRSGWFQQGSGALKVTRGDGDFYCCLGVACALAVVDGADVPVKQSSVVSGEWCFGREGTASSLPVEVQQWLGLEPGQWDPRLDNPESGGIVSAVSANDGYGWDFAKIADALEHTYLTSKEESDG